MSTFQTKVPRLPAFLADHQPPPQKTSLVNATIFDGDTVIKADTINVEAGRISAVGKAPRRGAQIVDLEGRFLMPGLIDAHAHVSMIEHSATFPGFLKGSEPPRPGLIGHLAASNLRAALHMGVTTIRDVGAYGDVLLDIRQAVRYGAFAAPRLLLCGRIVSATAPGGRFFPDMYREADGPDDMRKAVREQIRQGADFVKIMSTGARSVELEDPNPSQVTEAEMAAFVEEAHRQGYRAAAHCEGLDGTALAVESGCDTIEHGFNLTQRPDLLVQMKENDQTLVPTLSFLHHVSESGKWVDLLQEQGDYNVEQAKQTLRKARRAGVRIALGSDSPDPDGAAIELSRMIEYGMKPEEVLRSATSVGADALGIGESVGRLGEGMLADFLVVDGNPVRQPRLFSDRSKIWLVARNGEPVAGTSHRPG